MKRYTLFNGDADRNEFRAIFTFDAKSDEDAASKAFGWAQYQGYLTRDVKAVQTTGRELNWEPHNEYVARF